MTDIEKPKIEIAEISEDGRYGRFVCEPLEPGYGTTFGTVFESEDDDMWLDYSAIAAAYGIRARKVTSPEDFGVALDEALASGEPYLIDVPMRNIPTPTGGHWNILDIYSPDGVKGHVST